MTSQSLDSILSNIDCSKVKDICTNQPIPHFQLVQQNNTTTIIRDDHFNTTDFLSQRIRLVLTPEALYYLEQHNTSYKLVYPPLSITDTLIRPTLVDREIMGEYSIELRLHEKNIQVLQTADEKCRNDWIHNMDDPLLWRFLIDSKRMLKPRKKTSLIRRKDILSFYTDQAGEISPESSSDESEANDDDDDYSWEEGGAQSTQNDAAERKSINQHADKPLPNINKIEDDKRNSLMKSVMSVVSRPAPPSLRLQSSEPNLKQAVSNPPPLPPQHLTLPNSPYARALNQSTPSFNSSHYSQQSQSTLSLTPPLSRSSSPGTRYQSTISTSSSEDLGSPPSSPDINNHGNAIRQVLYSNDKCKVFRWKGESWYGVEGPCQLQVRQTYTNRSCVAVEMHDGQLYLNAWILPDTFLLLTSPTDISLSVTMFGVTENYLIHCETAQSAQKLVQILERMHKESHTISGTSTLRGAPPLLRSSSLPNCSDMSLKLVMQCKCKLYVQNEHAKWHSFGSVGLKISQQWSTRKMHIDLSNHTRLVSAMVQSRNVERLGPKRISFLLVDENEKNNVVYMVQVREELTGDKIFEYIKSKNSENGW